MAVLDAARSTQHRKEVTPHMHTPATTNPQDSHAQWKSCTAPDARRTHPTGTPHPGQRSRGPGSGSGSGSTLDAGRPGPPHRQHPNTRLPSTPLPLPLPPLNAQARQPRQPQPRQHTPTTATPASVAASPNPDPSRLGSSREPLANCSLAVADRLQLNRRPAPDPASDLGQPLASSSLTPGAQPKTGPAPARDLGQSLTFSSLTGCSPTETRPAPASARPDESEQVTAGSRWCSFHGPSRSALVRGKPSSGISWVMARSAGLSNLRRSLPASRN